MSINGCSFCDSNEVVLISGYKYCIRCARKLDRAWIIVTIGKVFGSLTTVRIRDLLTEMFGTDDYCFAMFSNLYDMCDRGPWLNRECKFEISQADYIVRAFHKHLGSAHPKLLERIEHD